MPARRTITFAAGLALAVSFVSPAAAGDVSDTQVGIQNAAPAFHGKVKSDNNFCVSNRKVTLYYKKRPGRSKKKLGADRANPSGKWKVTEATDGFILKSGLYWAKANRIVFEEGARMVCRGDRSRKVFVD